MHGQQSLVRCNNVFASRDGGQYELSGRFIAADQLDNNVDVRILDDLGRICRQHSGWNGEAAIAAGVTYCDLAYLHRNADSMADQFRVFP